MFSFGFDILESLKKMSLEEEVSYFKVPEEENYRLYDEDLETNKNRNVVTSGHTVEKTKVSSGISDLQGKSVFFKHNESTISLCETVFSECYSSLIDDKVPKVRAVYKKVGNGGFAILGVCSEEVPGFIDIRTLQNAAEWMKEVKWGELSTKGKNNFKLPKEEFTNSLGTKGIKVKKLYEIAKKHERILDATTGTIKFDDKAFVRGLAEVLVASYFFEEDDLHKNNFGINENGTPVRIDLDMSFFGSVYANTRKRRFGSGILYDITWDISVEDIINFPSLKKATPWYWPTICRESTLSFFCGDKFFTEEDALVFAGLAKNQDFVSAKYRCFLKALLIPKEQFEKIFTTYSFSEKDGFLGKDLLEHIKDRQKTLKQVLLAIPEFRDYLINRAQGDMEQKSKNLYTATLLKKPETGFNESTETLSLLKEQAIAINGIIDKIESNFLKEYFKKTAPSEFKKHIDEKDVKFINETLSNAAEEPKGLEAFKHLSYIKDKGEELGYKIDPTILIKAQIEIKNQKEINNKKLYIK